MILVDFKKFKKEYYCNNQCVSELNSKEICLPKSFFEDREYSEFLEFFNNPRNLAASKSEVLYPKVIVKTKLFKVIYPDAIVSKVDDKKIFIRLNNFRFIEEKSDSNIWLELKIVEDKFSKCYLRYHNETILNSKIY